MTALDLQPSRNNNEDNVSTFGASFKKKEGFKIKRGQSASLTKNQERHRNNFLVLDAVSVHRVPSSTLTQK